MRLRTKFEVDRTEAKLMGVCAGLANHTGIDATIVRIGFVVATVIGGWPWTVIAYVVLGMVGQRRRDRADRGDGVLVRSGSSPTRERTSELDRRLAEIDSYVAGSDSRLAREIDELR